MYEEGMQAYHSGGVISDCPYTETHQVEEWERGFNDAQEDAPYLSEA